ncbi:MAG: radical SAM protein [Candidatus Pacearchaeota archaeon]
MEKIKIANLYNIEKQFQKKIDNIIRNDPYPDTVEFHLTDKCNSKCIYCFNKSNKYNKFKQKNKNKILKTSEIFELLKEFKKLNIKKISFSGGGEPLLYKDISKILDFSIKLNFKTRLITNGYYINNLNKNILFNLKEIRISIDSFKVENYTKIRGVNKKFLERVINNLKKLTKLRTGKNKITGISLMLINECSKDLEYTIKRAKNLGINLIEIKNDIIKKKKKSKKLERILRNLVEKYNDKNFYINPRFEERFLPNISKYGCFVSYKRIAIDMHGNVFPCCLQAQPNFHATYFLENIHNFMSFKKLWKKTKIIRDNLKKYTKCKNCNFEDRLYNMYISKNIKKFEND